MRLSLSRKVLLLLAVPLAFQVALLGLLAWTHRAHTAALDDVSRSKDSVSLADRVLQLAVDAETGVRGYILTGDPEFTEPFDKAVDELPIAVRRLHQLSTGAPEQQALAESIEDAAIQSLDWLEQISDLIGVGQMGAADERVRNKDGKRLMDVLRDRVAAFRSAEDARNQERSRRIEATRRWVGGLWIVGTAVTVLITAAMAGFLWRGVGRRLKTLADNTHRLAAGQPLLPPLSGDDELSRLDQAFRYMADQLNAASDALRRSTSEVESLYNEAPCGYHSLDADGVIATVNQTELQWLGYKREDVVGRKRLGDLMTESSQRVFAATFPRFKQTGFARDVEYEFIRKDGSILPVLVNSIVVRDADGNYLSSRASLVDLTLRKQAEAAVHLFAEVVRNIPIGLIIYQLDPDAVLLRLRSANGAASRLLGVELEPAIGRDVLEVFPTISEHWSINFESWRELGRKSTLAK